ncbi:hypothetical protein AAF712_015209 [Marasmius tenuissimus]|uniref:Transposase n=1 Tax=Marasmius tenuissimus TaxID=585030 RepID=A0ABR2ZB54_9AGAR
MPPRVSAQNSTQATVKKRGRPPKPNEDNAMLTQLLAEIQSMKAAQENSSKENAQLRDELAALRGGSMRDENQNMDQDDPMLPAAGPELAATENSPVHAPAVEPASDFARRRQVLETLATQRANQPEGQQRPAAQQPAATDDTSAKEPMPRPPGRPGEKGFNLCIAMGLSRSQMGLQTYASLRRITHRFVHESRIPWDKYDWGTIASSDKSTLFAVMKEHAPVLGNYQNDWASEWLVRQYIKSLRSGGYKNKTLVRPPKYDYLVANSAKRDPTKSRQSLAKQDYLNRKQRAKEKQAEKQRKTRRISRRVEESDEEDRDDVVAGPSTEGQVALFGRVDENGGEGDGQE